MRLFGCKRVRLGSRLLSQQRSKRKQRETGGCLSQHVATSQLPVARRVREGMPGTIVRKSAWKYGHYECKNSMQCRPFVRTCLRSTGFSTAADVSRRRLHQSMYKNSLLQIIAIHKSFQAPFSISVLLVANLRRVFDAWLTKLNARSLS